MTTLTVQHVAKVLKIPVESVRATCNQLCIKIGPGGEFEYPDDERGRMRFHGHLVTRPLSMAEQLRHDLGVRLPRVVPEGLE